MLNHNYIPREVWIGFSKFDQNLVSQHTKVFCKLLSRACVSKSDSEVDIARFGQIISLCFHATKRISINIVGIDHVTSFPQGKRGTTSRGRDDDC